MRILKIPLHINYLWFLIPVSVTWVSSYLIHNGSWEPHKGRWDSAGLYLTIITAIIAVAVLVKRKDVFYKWLAVLMIAFMLREFHFKGTSTMVYVVALTLMIYAFVKFDYFEDYLYNTKLITPFACAIVCYIIAVGMDGHWWKFVPGGNEVWTLVEEIIEVTGHLFMMYTVTTAAPIAKTEKPT